MIIIKQLKIKIYLIFFRKTKKRGNKSGQLVEWLETFQKDDILSSRPLFKKPYDKNRLGPLYRIEDSISPSIESQVSLTDLMIINSTSNHIASISENKFKGRIFILLCIFLNLKI